MIQESADDGPTSEYPSIMPRTEQNWLNDTRTGQTLLFVFLAVVVLCFAAACFAFIRATTNWPMWVQIAIALPTGLLFFLCWAKAHETNGFDGIGVDESAKDREDENRAGPASA